ncbi:hypothetical protein PRUPE_1G294600 [Prunus persica]|uniref:Uncharacterized protein n=1 Tax=Prunus persica TaxID=3760 RepID=A0A251R525_PRUPE|nr:hypothetical protein PRUPE_1G294600 [Prunus persica]
MVASVPELVDTDVSLLAFPPLPGDEETKKHDLINGPNIVEPPPSLLSLITILLLIEFFRLAIYKSVEQHQNS